MGGPVIRVLVVDDYAPWRRYVRSTLQNRPEDFQVIGEVSDGAQAVQQAQELRPHLILLDIHLPNLNGIEAARQIRTISPTSKILFEVTRNGIQYIYQVSNLPGALIYLRASG